MEVYERLGDDPPEFNIARNDAAYEDDGAHTIDRHGPDIPLRRDPAIKTVEGRIYGDEGWGRPDNWSLRWTDHTIMNREINNYVRENWEEIRTNLAVEGVHNGAFNTGRRVGEGFTTTGCTASGRASPDTLPPASSVYRSTSFPVRTRHSRSSSPLSRPALCRSD